MRQLVRLLIMQEQVSSIGSDEPLRECPASAIREAELKYLIRKESQTVEKPRLYALPTSQLPLSNQSTRCWRTNRTTPLDFLGHLHGEVRMELLRRSTYMMVL